MTRNGKIVIIEDNIKKAARLSLELAELGYDICGIFSRPKEALSFIRDTHPDIVLLHQKLKGSLNGLEMGTASELPVIYFNKVSPTGGILEKLPAVIGSKIAEEKKRIKSGFREFQKTNFIQNQEKKDLHILKDRIFVRSRDRMVKIALAEIRYIEADRNYCRVYTASRNYLLVSTLKDVATKLRSPQFVRVHRSYLVNLSHIDEIATNQVVIANRSIPLSKGCRGELLKHLRVL